ncbi:MAG: hypothetical protein O9327_03320 [Polaromonas sp.]|nr:hypothetical protein [Polaromonas sp.]
MSDMRNSEGHYTLLGDSGKQREAGVNASDSFATAQGKQEERERNKKSPGFHHLEGELNARDKRQLQAFLATGTLLAAIGWVWLKTEASAGPGAYSATMRSTETKAYDRKFLEEQRRWDQDKLAYLFASEAPLSEIFKGCAAPDCSSVDVAALDAFKGWAKDKATPWDAQVCDYIVHAKKEVPRDKTYLGIKPDWILDRKNEACVATNRADVVKRVDRFNTVRTALAVVVAMALGGIVWRGITKGTR